MKAWDRNNAIATFVRNRRKEASYTLIDLADLTGIGLRFLRELEQGKPNVMTDKGNQLLQIFGHTLTPPPISDETRRDLDK
jgi:transcriptional regulator with XRE-family HTH domain